MAAAEQASSQKSETSWHDIVLQTLKRNEIKLVPYVPDRVLTTLIKNLHADPYFTTFPTAREEEAVGIVSGAWMAGMRGAVLMQTSGFATLANVLASLAVPYQIPLIMDLAALTFVLGSIRASFGLSTAETGLLSSMKAKNLLGSIAG